MSKTLFDKIKEAYDKERAEEAASFIPQRFVANDPENDDGDGWTDFPYIQDPEEYITNRPLENTLTEQDKDEEKAPKEPVENPETAGADAGGDIGGDLGAGEDLGAAPGADAGLGADQGFGLDQGLENQPEPLNSTQLGRVYELKKIYSRLSSVETFLARTTDIEILEVRKMVSEAINLFELVITNYEQYKDKIDDIIIVFYDFLSSIFTLLKKYYSKISEE